MKKKQLKHFTKLTIEETPKFFGGQGDCNGTNSTNTYVHCDTYMSNYGSSGYNDWDDEGCC